MDNIFLRIKDKQIKEDFDKQYFAIKKWSFLAFQAMVITTQILQLIFSVINGQQIFWQSVCINLGMAVCGIIITFIFQKLISLACFFQIVIISMVYILNRLSESKQYGEENIMHLIVGIIVPYGSLTIGVIVSKWFFSALYILMAVIYLAIRLQIQSERGIRVTTFLEYFVMSIGLIMAIYVLEKISKRNFITQYKQTQMIKNFTKIMQSHIQSAMCVIEYHRDDEYAFKIQNDQFVSLFPNIDTFLDMELIEKEKGSENGYEQLNSPQFNKDKGCKVMTMGEYLNVKLIGEMKSSMEQYQKVLNCKVTSQEVTHLYEIAISQCTWGNNKIAANIIFHDITDRIAYQEYKLNKMKEVNDFKDKILATVSHDLRTPLNSIINNVELADLETRSTPLNFEKIHNLHNIIKSSSDMLLLLVHDILDYSVSQHHKLKIQPCEFKLINALCEVQQLLRIPAEKKGISLEVKWNLKDQNETMVIYQDKLRLKQILTNLVGNALKFTQQGYIFLEVNSNENDELITITVRDSGIGISEDVLPKIFDLYETYDSPARSPVGKETGISTNAPGIGLGLAISKELVGLLGERSFIKVESSEGLGSAFSFDIFRHIPNQDKRNKKNVNQNNNNNSSSTDLLLNQSDIPNLFDIQSKSLIERQQISYIATFHSKHIEKRHLKILIVDDNPFNTETLTQIILFNLKFHYSIEIKSVYNGKEAVQEVLHYYKSKSKSYDIIFMDLNMPIMDGYEATLEMEKYAQQGQIQKQKVWLCSANISHSNISQADLNLHFQEVILKPVQAPTLKKLILKYF